jgi:hypothetical protein
VVNTCWCWHICEGSGVCVVERGLGSALFVEVKRLFSTTPEVEKKWRRTKVTVVTGR